jgi:hypothetical protein
VRGDVAGDLAGAVPELSLSYWVDSTVMPGYFAFISWSKPWMRASVVLMPGLTSMTATVPLASDLLGEAVRRQRAAGTARG